MTTERDELSGRCPECGADVRGGRAGCQQLCDEVLAREFGDYRYAREHRLTVDAYSLQHPDEYMRSAKSYAAHLTGAYVAFVRRADWWETRTLRQPRRRGRTGDSSWGFHHWSGRTLLAQRT